MQKIHKKLSIHHHLAFILFFLICCPAASPAKLVIAQGGAAGYIMEHNLAASTLAVAMEADLIKMDLLLTREGEVIVHGSPTLEMGTNIAELFPGRAREDGLFYALDFHMNEIRQLSLRDPAGRFPVDLHPRLHIPTLEEELSLLRGLEKSLNRSIAIAVEIKQPWLHRKEGRDISSAALNILQKFGYGREGDKSSLLSYDAQELARIKKNLLPERQMSLKLVQLIESNEGRETMGEEWGEWVSYNYDWMFSNSGLRSLAGSVDAIALPKYMLVDPQGKLQLEDFVKKAQQLGIMIFTFPVDREERTRLPFVKTLEEELSYLYFSAGVDGIITDFCGDVSRYLKNRPSPPLVQTEEDPATPPAGEADNDPLQLTTPFNFQGGEKN